MTQRCRRCKKELSVDKFSRDHKRNSYQRYCKECFARYKKERAAKDARRVTKPAYVGTREKPSERTTYRMRDQKDRYLLMRALIERQDGRCPICKRDLGPKPVLDRDDITQRIRGLVCPPCRLGLEGFGADPVTLRRAVKYLETK